MQVLLINQNATIERLVKLSSGKQGYELVTASDLTLAPDGQYGLIVIDGDLYSQEGFSTLKQKFNVSNYILIVTKGAPRPGGFDVYVEKPFLPTELLDVFSDLEKAPPKQPPAEPAPVAADPFAQAATNDEAIGDDMFDFGANIDDDTSAHEDNKDFSFHGFEGLGELEAPQEDEFKALDNYDFEEEAELEDVSVGGHDETDDGLEFSFDEAADHHELLASDDDHMDDFSLENEQEKIGDIEDFDFSLGDEDEATSLAKNSFEQKNAQEDFGDLDDALGGEFSFDESEALAQEGGGNEFSFDDASSEGALSFDADDEVKEFSFDEDKDEGAELDGVDEFSFDDDISAAKESADELSFASTLGEEDFSFDADGETKEFSFDEDKEGGAELDEVNEFSFDEPIEAFDEEGTQELKEPSSSASVEADPFAELDSIDDMSSLEDDFEESDFDASGAQNADIEPLAAQTEFDVGDEYADFENDEAEFDALEEHNIFDKDEVSRLKDLLDETTEGDMDGDEFDLENVKIFNDEFGSLTEESLTEALGSSTNSKDTHNNLEDNDLDSMDDSSLKPLPEAPAAVAASALAAAATTALDKTEAQAANVQPSQAIQLNPNQSVTFSLEALRELLSIADININITLTKKQ